MAWYSESLRIRRMILGNDHLDVGASLSNLGQTYHQMGELKKAMELYQEFWCLAKVRLGENHRDIASILSSIAQIHHEQKEHDKAIEYYVKALQ
eukprot:5207298-Ditylum_brightwellii.AAC.1